MSDWGSGRATCRCGAEWSGHALCHCGGCHRTYGGLKIFDAHRVGGRCVDLTTTRTKSGKPVAECREGIVRQPGTRAPGIFLPAMTRAA